MTWVKLDDQFYEDETVLGLTSAASIALYVVGIAYCGNKLNDGLIPPVALRRQLLSAAFADQSHADELVLAGLWELRDDGKYLVRNFLKFNRSRDQVDNDRDQAKKRMQKKRGAPKPANPENSTGVRANIDRSSVGVLSVSVSDSVDLELKEKVTDRFDEFWDAYGKKRVRSTAETQWAKHVNATNVDAVIAAAHAQRIAEPRTKFRPDPHRWLRDGRWQDEIISTNPTPGNRTHNGPDEGWDVLGLGPTNVSPTVYDASNPTESNR